MPPQIQIAAGRALDRIAENSGTHRRVETDDELRARLGMALAHDVGSLAHLKASARRALEADRPHFVSQALAERDLALSLLRDQAPPRLWNRIGWACKLFFRLLRKPAS